MATARTEIGLELPEAPRDSQSGKTKTKPAVTLQLTVVVLLDYLFARRREMRVRNIAVL